MPILLSLKLVSLFENSLFFDGYLHENNSTFVGSSLLIVCPVTFWSLTCNSTYHIIFSKHCRPSLFFYRLWDFPVSSFHRCHLQSSSTPNSQISTSSNYAVRLKSYFSSCGCWLKSSAVFSHLSSGVPLARLHSFFFIAVDLLTLIVIQVYPLLLWCPLCAYCCF